MEKPIELFKALSDENRLNIILLLSEKRICAKGLSKILGISEPAVSQHIKVLKNVGLLKGEKIGYFVHYNVQKDIIKEVSQFLERLTEDQIQMQAANCQANCSKAKRKGTK